MALSATIIPIVDTIAKTLSSSASPAFLVSARYAIGAALALAVFRSPRRAAHAFRQAPALHVGRAALLVAAMATFYGAISELPVATALGGFFTGPIIAALLSLVVLGERTTRTQIAAIVLGFCGAMLILQPHSDAANPAGLLALSSGALSGVYLVLTRSASVRVGGRDNVLIQSVIGAALIVPVAAFDLPALRWTPAALVLLMGVLSFVAHGLFLAAFQTLDVSTIAPLAYIEIVWAAAFGWMLFGELPTPLAIAGIVSIVASGLLIARTVGSGTEPAGATTPAGVAP